MTKWEARARLAQAAMNWASLEIDPFKETMDPHHDAGVELAEEQLDHAIREYMEAS